MKKPEYQIDDLKSTIESFVEADYNDRNGRYKSWDFCYNHFRKLFKKRRVSPAEKRQAALVLAFYLASWGMYRGSSFLLKAYTYTVHIKTIGILLEKKDLLKKRYIKKENKKDLDELFKLIKKLRKHYNNLKKKADEKEKISKKNTDTSDTLISKIIMGTSGLIPAYDRNVKKALREKHICQTLSQDKYIQIIQLFEDNEKNIKDLRRTYPKVKIYPPMKILDMYLFEKGSRIKD